MQTIIKTDVFAVTPPQYVKAVAAAHAGSIPAIALYLLVGVSLGVLPALLGVRGLLLWFVLVMLLLPMVLALAWFHTALSPGAALQTLPHRVEVDTEQSLISLVFEPKDENSSPRPAITVSQKNIARVAASGGNLLLKLDDAEVEYILFPPHDAMKLKKLFAHLLPSDTYEA